MARELNEVQQVLLTAKEAASELSALEVLTPQEQLLYDVDSTSNVANWRLWVYINASAQQNQEQLWDVFAAEIEARIKSTRVHNETWYRDKALAYQHGFALGESDVYDNTGYTNEQIQASKIIANAAVVKLQQNGYGIIRIKVVKKVDNELVPLTPEELAGFKAYMNIVGDAGTTVTSTSADADLLKIQIDVYYDATVLSASGARLDGTDANPLSNGIEAYLKSQVFNGRLIRRKLENHIEAIPGVVVPKIRAMWTKYGTYGYETTGIQNVGIIDEIRTPDSGYLKLDELTVNWIASE